MDVDDSCRKIPAAHDSDAITDTSLYTTGSRTDESPMFMVYGMGVGQILSLSIKSVHK